VSDRVYKGRLQVQKSEAFDESATDFDVQHKGGLNPFDLLRDVLYALAYREVSGARIGSTDDSVQVSDNGVSIIISRDGVIEIVT